MLLLQRNGTDLSIGLDQVFDAASAMNNEGLGVVSLIKNQQPSAEYSHCQNHVLNLANSYACKNC